MSDIDRYLTEEVAEKAARAEWEHEWPERAWEKAPDNIRDFYISAELAALSTVLPGIIQKAKAEALRDAAGSPIPRGALARETRTWLRARADEIAGDDS